MKVQEKSGKYKSLYDQFSEDAAYLKEKVNELKELSPQVKGLVVETKDAFTEAKDEYKTIVSENPAGERMVSEKERSGRAVNKKVSTTPKPEQKLESEFEADEE